MSGNLRGPKSLDLNSNRKLIADGRESPISPLKIFGLAKKKINDIFIEVAADIDEGNDFIKSLNFEPNLITDEERENFAKLREKVSGIREILRRDRMKVAFFGRTSNGKSTVINAMLRNRIMPSGIGHTTNCFLQVEGCDGNEGYLIAEPDQQHMSIQSISQLASALSKVKLNNDTLIRICWPKHMCHLLRDDVVLVDSPGVDVSPDLDSWIDMFCLDADVFVLVANAESTLMQTEKNFFHRVSERLSKPNIFILNNRWDASASEMETMDEVKRQHLERNIEFLAEELKVCSAEEAEMRVFFVSAKEMLVNRVNEDRGTPTPSSQMLQGFESRSFEFARFERIFEECISQSAVETKFALHAENGKAITKFLYKLMDSICIASVDVRMSKKIEFDKQMGKLEFTDQQLVELTSDIKEKIKSMTEEVEDKVSSALTEEIKKLSILVDEFNFPFNSQQRHLNEYKKKLHNHVELGLSTNLQSRCSDALKTAVTHTSKEMADKLLTLMPEESKQKTLSLLPINSNFEMAYRLDCRNLCAEFSEDIDFRFSLGFSTLIKRFAGLRQQTPKPKLSRTTSYPGSSHSLVAEASSVSMETDLMVTMFSAFSSLYSGTTVGILAIMGLLGKAAGWKVLGFCGAIYGALYLYERLTWTNSAMEKAFKRQYVEYASSKLKLIVDLTSANCSHQVQQELNSTLNRLCHEVEMTKSELERNLIKLEKEIFHLDEASKNSIILKNKVQVSDDELNSFIAQYIKHSSSSSSLPLPHFSSASSLV